MPRREMPSWYKSAVAEKNKPVYGPPKPEVTKLANRQVGRRHPVTQTVVVSKSAIVNALRNKGRKDRSHPLLPGG